MLPPNNRKLSRWGAGLSLVVVAVALMALSTPTSAKERLPLLSGPYLTLMGGYVSARGSDVELDDGYGAVIGAGYRKGFYAVEGSAVMASLSGSGDTDARLQGGAISGLLYPLQRFPGLYLSAGVGALEIEDYPTHPDASFSVTTLQGSLGHIWSLRWGRYAFGIRAEAGYRQGRREARINAARQDIDAPRRFSDTLLHVGLHLPLSLIPPSFPESTTSPVQVVPSQSRPPEPAPAQSTEAAPEAVDSPTVDAEPPPRQAPRTPSEDDDDLDFLLQMGR